MILQGVIYSETAAANYPDPDVFNRSLHIIPARRLGYPEEVAECAMETLPSFTSSSPSLPPPSLPPPLPSQVSGAVCFLLSPAAAYITGCTVAVDGGQGIYRSPWVIPGEGGGGGGSQGSSPVRGGREEREEEWSDDGMNINVVLYIGEGGREGKRSGMMIGQM